MKHKLLAICFSMVSLASAGLANATPTGCEAKGSLYIIDKGNVVSTVNVTPGAGTTAALSNQGHPGFKTDANGNFNISFPPATLTPTQGYYFRMETYNSQYLAYGLPGFPNSFKVMSSPVSGQVMCGNPAIPSESAGIKLAPQTAQVCQTIAVNMAQPFAASAITLPGTPKKLVSLTGDYVVNGVTYPIHMNAPNGSPYNQPRTSIVPGLSGIYTFGVLNNAALVPAAGATNIAQGGNTNYLSMNSAIKPNTYLVPGVSPSLVLPATTTGTVTLCVQ